MKQEQLTALSLFLFSMLKATATQGITVRSYNQKRCFIFSSNYSSLSATAKAVIWIWVWEPSYVTNRA